MKYRKNFFETLISRVKAFKPLKDGGKEDSRNHQPSSKESRDRSKSEVDISLTKK